MTDEYDQQSDIGGETPEERLFRMKTENLNAREALLNEREKLIKEAAELQGKDASLLKRAFLNPWVIAGTVTTVICASIWVYNFLRSPKPSLFFKKQKAAIELRLERDAGKADTPFAKCSYDVTSDAFSSIVENVYHSFNSARKLPPDAHRTLKFAFHRDQANGMKKCEGKYGEAEYNRTQKPYVDASMDSLIEHLRAK